VSTRQAFRTHVQYLRMLITVSTPPSSRVAASLLCAPAFRVDDGRFVFNRKISKRLPCSPHIDLGLFLLVRLEGIKKQARTWPPPPALCCHVLIRSAVTTAQRCKLSFGKTTWKIIEASIHCFQKTPTTLFRVTVRCVFA
jgi:hypothetical protein